MALDLSLAAALLRRMCYYCCTYYADCSITREELDAICAKCPAKTLQEIIQDEIKEATP